MAITSDRTTIAAAVIAALGAMGSGSPLVPYWGTERIRSTDDYQMVPMDMFHCPPFVQIQDQDTLFITKSTLTSTMKYPILIVFYADLNDVHWTLQGRVDHSIRYLQDQVRNAFLRGDLGGIVHKTEVTRLIQPRPLPALMQGSEEPGGFMAAGAELMITVDTAG